MATTMPELLAENQRMVVARTAERENRVQVLTYKITLRCAVCDTGLMNVVPPGMPTHPLNRLHICNNCGVTEEVPGASGTYPRVDTEEAP